MNNKFKKKKKLEYNLKTLKMIALYCFKPS